MEIVAKYNSADYLEKVIAEETGTTFKAQSIAWMAQCRNRKRKPIRPVTLVNWQSYLDNHILPVLGSEPIAKVNNASLKQLASILAGQGYAPQSIKNICLVVKMVKASAVDANGNELHPIKWNAEFIDAPVVDKRKQNAPSVRSEIMTGLAAWKKKRERTVFILCGAAGLRIGEALGVEIDKHISSDFQTITIKQKVRSGVVEGWLKTANGEREVDLHPSVAALLKEFVDDRKKGFMFCTGTGKPLTLTNVIRRHLHPALQAVAYVNKFTGTHKAGTHIFRRFRDTYLRNKTSCPDGLIKYWMGHAGRDMSDLYDKIREDVEFRREVADRVGIGFELPKLSIVPNVPNSAEEVGAVKA
jgi:integrase